MLVDGKSRAQVTGFTDRTDFFQATIEKIGATLNEIMAFRDGLGDLNGANLRFHLHILNATGNQFVRALGDLIYAPLFGALEFQGGTSRTRDERLQQYGEVFTAICDRKPTLARQRMDMLLTDSFGHVCEVLRRSD